MELILDPSLEKVLHNHEWRIAHLEMLPSGCKFPDEPPTVCMSSADDLPAEPACGVCYVVCDGESETEDCTTGEDCDGDGDGEVPCEGCVTDSAGGSVMGSPEWEYLTGPVENIATYQPDGGYYYGDTDEIRSLIWPEEFDFAAPQTIEVNVTNFGHPGPPGEPTWASDWVVLICRVGPTTDLDDTQMILGTIYKEDGIPDGGFFDHEIWVSNPDGTELYENYVAHVPWTFGEEFVVRLESDADGSVRLFLNGMILQKVVVTGLVEQPSKIGLWVDNDWGGSGLEAESPHITDICINGAGFFDDFVRPGTGDEIGPNWVVPPDNTYFEQTNVPLMVEDGAAIGRRNESNRGGPRYVSTGYWFEEMPGDQFIEVCVTGLDYNTDEYPLSMQMFGWIYLFAQASEASLEREECLVTWIAEGGVVPCCGTRWVDCYSILADGDTSDDSAFHTFREPWPPYYDDPVVSVKLEALLDGTRRLYWDMGEQGATTLFLEGTSAVPDQLGPFMGIELVWDRFDSEGMGGSSPRVLWARGGVIGGTCTLTEEPVVSRTAWNESAGPLWQSGGWVRTPRDPSDRRGRIRTDAYAAR